MPRQGPTQCVLEVGKMFEGIPIVTEYKYLGMWVNQKLTLDPQMDHIDKKCKFLVTP